MPVKALMVDVDGVIVVRGHQDGWSVHLDRDLGVDPARLQAKFFKQHFGDVVHGRAALHDRLAPVLAEIAPHVTAEELIAYWFANDAVLNEDLLEELAEMRARGIALHLATVQEHNRARYLWETLGLSDLFDDMHYAADMGVAKPAPGFYKTIEQRTGLRGNDIFFIDDSAANVEAALDCGWQAAVWTGEETLASVLEAAGLNSGFLP